MRVEMMQLVLSASDLANHLGCRYRTLLELRHARGEVDPPRWRDPALEVLVELGKRHEDAYVASLQSKGLGVDKISAQGDAAIAETIRALERGAEAVVQGSLSCRGWFGRTDVLLRVPGRSRFGNWAYEVHDTKLSSETRAGAILQLCLYTHLLAELQGSTPEHFRIVKPHRGGPEGFVVESHRWDDFAAYYRLVRASLERAAADGMPGLAHYPEPVAHCDVCRWWPRCDARWREDDHLSLVAGITRLQMRECQLVGVVTLESLATQPEPLPWKPRRGSLESFERSRNQARVQLEGRRAGAPVSELLPVEPGLGLARLPQPTPGDLFLDLEGDPFVDGGGREYLFGFARQRTGDTPEYEAQWALDEAEERAAFEAIVDRMMAAWDADPGWHVYHYAPYEPGALKRLMGRYGTREEEVDRLLRGGRFVDLYAVVRQGLRASVERYSIKHLEALFGYTRDMDLRDVAKPKRAVERALELGETWAIAEDSRAVVEAYNRDDCLSALRLRDWLEAQRAGLEASGIVVPRPVDGDGAPPEKTSERRERARGLAAQLTEGLPSVPSERDPGQQARWLLAQLLEFHWREEKSLWWEYFRLVELSDEQLLDERAAIAGLEWVERVDAPGTKTVDRYRFPAQETDVRPDDELRMGGAAFAGVASESERTIGKVATIDIIARTVDIQKIAKRADVHPSAVFRHKIIGAVAMEDSLFRLGEHVRDQGLESTGMLRVALDLLLARPPRLADGESITPLPGESTIVRAVRLAHALDDTVLPIQGPPGTGKTYTGARMIAALARAGRKIGVTANSHKVIRKLLDEVLEAAKPECDVSCAQKPGDDPLEGNGVLIVKDNAEALAVLEDGTAQVLGGTPWLWAREEFAGAVDVLFVDEAGQMSLANALAVSQTARSVVLLGDPRQLDQPVTGSHPDGAAASALEHLLGDHLTLPDDRGLFLSETWRLAPPIRAFTSCSFYENRLGGIPELETLGLEGTAPVTGVGLYLVPVAHEGNTNTAPEEVDAVEEIVAALLGKGTLWIDPKGVRHPLGPEDVLVVAPYNAHVSRIGERLAGLGVAVGTVDKFQGQEAPVVIYSLATSTPEDAPRGMEFLYSLNRLNVATSRARCACILVGSPALFEPECRSPRQMQLANAFCRYVELARVAPLESIRRDGIARRHGEPIRATEE